MEQTLQTSWPGIWLQGKALRSDLVAGLTVAAVTVPQAMGYALLAGLPPQYALYTAVVVAALGSLLGSSAHLITGPTNVIALVVFSATASLARSAGEELGLSDLVGAVCLLGLMAGGIQVVIALLKVGDLTRYVSESVILGFVLGASSLIALGQLPVLLGLQEVGSGHEPILWRLWLSLSQGGPVRWEALVLGLGTILVVLLLSRVGNRYRVVLPDLLLALILASVAASVFGWHPPESRLEVSWGLPAFRLPALRLDWLQRLSGSALAVALIGLVEALGIARSIAAQTHQRLDFNRECLAQGVANLGGALFQCLPGSGSLTRSTINYQAGAASRLAGLIAAGCVAASLLLFSSLARYVPLPALAGILVVTAWRQLDRRRLRYCMRTGRFDAGLVLSTAGTALFFSIDYAILIGIFLSFLLFIPRAARLQSSELIISPNRVIRERHPDDPRCGRLVLYSLEGEMFFGAAPELEEYLNELRRHVEQGARVIVLRLKRIRNPDMVCLEQLQHFLQEMQQKKVPVLLCGVRPGFAHALARLGFHHWLPKEWLYLEEVDVGSSTLEAVRHAYELLGEDLCPTCPRRAEAGQPEWYYMI
jgi:SulP family sulfate permease